MRHITALETDLGLKVFDRKPDGYEPTDFGLEFLTISKKMALDFDEFYAARRANTVAPSKSIRVLASSHLTEPIMTALARVRETSSDLWFIYGTAGDQSYNRLDLVDIVFGHQNLNSPVHHAQFLGKMSFGLFASSSYVERNSTPKSVSAFLDHRFVVCSDGPSGFEPDTWLRKHALSRNIVLQTECQSSLQSAIHKGVGIGCLPLRCVPPNMHLTRILADSAVWREEVWAFTPRAQAIGSTAQQLVDAVRKVIRHDIQ